MDDSSLGATASLAVMAFGAILAWAVTGHISGLDLHILGLILVVAGVVGLVLSVLLRLAHLGLGPWAREEARRDVVHRHFRDFR